MGKNLYVDDLVTTSKARSMAYGEKLMAWLQEEATKESCQVFHLDSGTHRGQAHKFYFQQGLTIASYHFSKSLKTPWIPPKHTETQAISQNWLLSDRNFGIKRGSFCG